jgi:hypothetical protein
MNLQIVQSERNCGLGIICRGKVARRSADRHLESNNTLVAVSLNDFCSESPLISLKVELYLGQKLLDS